MTGRGCLATLMLLALGSWGCSIARNPLVAYTPPAVTTYHNKPRLEQQYLRAHMAGWRDAVLATSPSDLRSMAGGAFVSYGKTCCEATQNVTAGWYRGQQDAQDFLTMLAARLPSDATIIPAYRALCRELEDAPPQDWYVPDGYDPSRTVTEVAAEGDVRVETTYRDETKGTLLRIDRYRGGVLDGDREQYDANGELSCVTPYKDGRIDGVQRYYSDTGDLVVEVTYVHGEEQGTRRFDNERGGPEGEAQ